MLLPTPLTATTDQMQAWGSTIGAAATVAATVGAWIAVKISLTTSRQAEADRAIEARERADRRRDQREAQARKVALEPLVPGSTTTTGAGQPATTSHRLRVVNGSADPIFAVELAVEIDPTSAVDPSDRFYSTRRLSRDVLAPGQALEVVGQTDLRWSDERAGAADFVARPWLAFTDLNGVRWNRGPDYVLREAARAETVEP